MENKKRKKSKRQRKVLIALLMLLMLSVVLGSSTYAWFTANKTVTVSTINVNVAASNGLQISADSIEWKTIITNDDILRIINEKGTDTATYPTAINQLPNSQTALAPVSSVGTVDSAGMMEMYLGELNSDAQGNYLLTATKSTETSSTTSGNFVVFDLFFQVQQETQIYLTNNSKVIAGGTDTGIHNAARIAFIVEGNVPAGTAAAQAQALINANATPVIWEPNNDTHTPAAIQNAVNVYGHSNVLATGSTPLSYHGVKAAISTGVALNSTDTAYFAPVTPTISTPSTGILDSAFKPVFTLEPGISKVRVYMWVEGQDVDCETIASGGQISFDVQFSSNSNATGA